MKVKSVICQGQARVISDAMQAWKQDREEAMAARDAEDVIALYLVLRDFLRHWLDEAWQRLFADQLVDVPETGTALRRALQAAAELAAELRECVSAAERNGYGVPNAEAFATAEEDIGRLAADLDARWPWLNEERGQRGWEDYLAGRYRAAKEILDELQRSGS